MAGSLSHGGKRPAQRIEAPREEINRCPDPTDSKTSFLLNNSPATWESLGVDVATAIKVTLNDTKVTLIPTNVYCPMYSTTSLVGGLLLGRSSTSKQGVIVIPGVIDAAFTGQVKIMVHVLQPPVTIPKGSKIAQIVAIENFLPHRQRPKEPTDSERQDNGFGSTGHDVSFTINLKDRPYKKVQLQRGSRRVRLEPMLNTGADVSIINQMYWPSNWPLRAPSSHITWNKEPLNVVSDSLYVVGVVQRIEDALLRRTQNQHLGELFLQLQSVLKQRQHMCGVKHTTGIPHSSTSQAIVERANRTLKEYLAKPKQKGREEPVDVIHHQAVKEERLQAVPGLYVYHKDMQTGEW
ncbi:hypothetical protein DV515_00015839 [Chloebia gouldiae]|uniref:Peptidase A2 domain-containing protein n=1 Tax=Chloebia gouldiae TaxID=44316 RepID=A0A3L8RUK1_CHLGU|nr:hypothetical protein DV515_00015839 [Chloebia gouldiae]